MTFSRIQIQICSTFFAMGVALSSSALADTSQENLYREILSLERQGHITGVFPASRALSINNKTYSITAKTRMYTNSGTGLSPIVNLSSIQIGSAANFLSADGASIELLWIP